MQDQHEKKASLGHFANKQINKCPLNMFRSVFFIYYLFIFKFKNKKLYIYIFLGYF